MNEFNHDNTEGYTDIQLEKFNAEWGEICDVKKLTENDSEYHDELGYFSDEVSHRYFSAV